MSAAGLASFLLIIYLVWPLSMPRYIGVLVCVLIIMGKLP